MFPLKDSIKIKCIPFITWSLVLLNIICFVLQMFIPSEQFEACLTSLALVPASFITHFGLVQLSTVFSSMFIHAGLAHLAGNMWFLHIFGNSVEDRIGHFKYLLLYFCGGIFAAILQVMIDTHSTLPMIGASGAIAGVLGAYFVFFPRATVQTVLLFGFFARVAEIPAGFYLGLWFLMQLASGLFAIAGPAAQGAMQVAFWAHAGGFIAGVAAARLICLSEEKISIEIADDWFRHKNSFSG